MHLNYGLSFCTKTSTYNTVIVNRHHRLWTVSLLLENLRACAICKYASGEAMRNELWSSKHTKNYNRICVYISVPFKMYSVNSPLCVRLCFLQRFWLELTGREYSWFATTWQGGHVGDQYNRFFTRIIYVKMVFSSQRREMVVFLITNIRVERTWVCLCVGGGGGGEKDGEGRRIGKG